MFHLCDKPAEQQDFTSLVVYKETVLDVGGLVDWMDSVNGRSLTSDSQVTVGVLILLTLVLHVCVTN